MLNHECALLDFFHHLTFSVCLPFSTSGEYLVLQVVCRQLGFLGTGARAYSFAHFGRGSGPIVLDNVRCTGLEAYITDCPNNGLYIHNCRHYEDAGVSCVGKYTQLTEKKPSLG